MIVWRITSQAKIGRTRELVELTKSMQAAFPDPNAVRICVSHPAGAPTYNVVTDIEFESLAALEQWLGEWFADADSRALFQKMEALQEPGGHSTLWNLVQ